MKDERYNLYMFRRGWHVPERAKGVSSRVPTPFAAFRDVPPRIHGVVLTRLLAAIPSPLSSLLFPLFLILLALSAGAAEKDSEKSAAQLVTPAAERAIENGLKWLGRRATRRRRLRLRLIARQRGRLGPGRHGHDVGGEHARPRPLRRPVNRASIICWPTRQPSGFIAGPDASHGPMYGHGFATMFLAECYGMSPRPELREKLAKAVKIIVNSQNKDGGWRYQPVRADADISVTVCQIMALRAARNAGLYVPNETINRAIDYVKRSQNADGGFMYMIQGGRERVSTLGRRRGGPVQRRHLQRAGNRQGARLPDAVHSQREAPTAARATISTAIITPCRPCGRPAAERWDRWYPAVRDDLIARQRDDGSWLAPEGNECATAMACIVLQIPNNYLPIFQR